LNIAHILPAMEHKDPVYSFHYKGSATKPPCDENVYWFVYEAILDIKSNVIDHLKDLYLTDENMYPKHEDAR
jgi:carbonic anhydrase